MIGGNPWWWMVNERQKWYWELSESREIALAGWQSLATIKKLPCRAGLFNY